MTSEDFARQAADAERIIPLQGTLNTRDLGGYPAQGGAVTTFRRVLRSDSLHRLTDADRETLREIGIRAIIDLRRTDEVDGEPDQLGNLSIAYYNLPILPQAVTSAQANSQLAQVSSLTGVYKAILDYFQGPLLTVFETIAAYAGEPVVIHCTAGKDRTGVVSALLLDLVGVPQAEIVHDYAITAGRIAPMLERLRAGALTAGLDMPRYERMLLCEPQMMEETLAHLYNRYGGAATYLSTIGLSAAQIAALRSSLLP